MKVFLKSLLVLIFVIVVKNTFAAKILIESDFQDISISESTAISVSVFDLQQIEEVRLEGIEGNFKVASTARMNRVVILNGRASQIQTIKFYLLPIKKGNYKIFAKVYTAQKTYKSKSIRIKVRKSGRKIKANGRDVFVETLVTPKKAYLGQKISYLINFYTKYFPYGGPSFEENFALKDFIVKNITERSAKTNTKQIGNVNYYYFRILKLLLIPTKTGKYEIPSKEFRITLQNRHAESFVNIGKVHFLKTHKQEIEILPLPTLGKPAKFSGLVGEAKLEYKISTQQINFGEPVKLKVKITGNLNLENLEKIIVNKPENFKVYENEVSSIEDIREGKYYSEKNFEIVLVADKSGRLEFPEIKIPFFNTRTKAYDSLKIPTFEVIVQGNSQNETESEDIIIKVKKPLDSYKFKDYIVLKIKKSYLWISLIAIVVLILILVSYKYLKPLLFKKAKKSNLEQLWENLNIDNSALNAYEFLESFFREKFQLSLKSSSQEKIEELMTAKEFSEKTIRFTVDCLRCIDLEKYGMKEENINYVYMLKPLYENKINI